MELGFSRRRMMQGVGGAAIAQSIPAGAAAPGARKWPIEEGPDTPKLALGPTDGGAPLSPPPAGPSQAGRGAGGFGFGGGKGAAEGRFMSLGLSSL